MNGAELISNERNRQINRLGWSAEHDDDHASGELAMAAACYAAPGRIYRCVFGKDKTTFIEPWPWAKSDDKRYDYGTDWITDDQLIHQSKTRGSLPNPVTFSITQRIDLLVKAGALIAAEIDRLQRDENDR